MPQTTLPPPDVESNGQAAKAPIDLTRPALHGGGYYGVSSVTETISRLRDEAENQYGYELYDWMADDPIAGGSFDVLKNFTLSGGLQLLPNKRPGAGEQVDDPKLQEAYDTSAWVADYCQWVMDRMDTTSDDVLAEFCEQAWGHGNQLADIPWKNVPRGDYDGTLPASTGGRVMAIEGIDHKPRQSYRYMVDPIRRTLKAIRGVNDKGEPKLYSVDKFAIAFWAARKSDPRKWGGQSIYRRAVHAWNVRTQTWPEFFKYTQRFGTPAPYGKLASDNGLDIYKKQDVLGGKSVAETFLEDLLAWRNGQGFVMRSGDDLGLKEPSGKGEVFQKLLDLSRVEIVLAILYQVGATQESQFDSRAKSQTSMDVLGNILRYMKRWVCRFWEWQVLYKIVWFNWGRRFADLYTPIASLGDADKADTSAMLTALSRAGYRLTESQLPELDAMAGVPIRKPGEESIPVAGTVSPPVEPPAEAA